jgi:prepilin-type N-terminal cleavage/methylation domain-containing protein
MRNQSGFTLIELVIVIIILGILAAFAVPKFLDMSQEAHLAKVKASRGSFKAGVTMAYAKCQANGWNSSTGVQVDDTFTNTLDFNADCWPINGGGGDGATGAAAIFNAILDEDVRAASDESEVFETSDDGTLNTYTYTKGTDDYSFSYNEDNGVVSTVSY